MDKTNPSETDPEHKLIADLMKNYDLDARPVLNKSKPVDVSFDLAFNQIIELVILHSLWSMILFSVDNWICSKQFFPEVQYKGGYSLEET